MAFDWETFKPGDRIEVGKDDTASPSHLIEYTKRLASRGCTAPRTVRNCRDG